MFYFHPLWEKTTHSIEKIWHQLCRCWISVVIRLSRVFTTQIYHNFKFILIQSFISLVKSVFKLSSILVLVMNFLRDILSDNHVVVIIDYWTQLIWLLFPKLLLNGHWTSSFVEPTNHCVLLIGIAFAISVKVLWVIFVIFLKYHFLFFVEFVYFGLLFCVVPCIILDFICHDST